MSETVVIGITGVARSGKTTIARKLREMYMRRGNRVAVLSLASPIKNFLVELGVLKRDPEFRKAAQALGSMRTYLGESVYVRTLMSLIQGMESEKSGWVIIIDDIRYPNEMEEIRKVYPALCVRLKRAGAGLSGDEGNHASETSVDRVVADFEVENNETAHQCASKVFWVTRQSLIADPVRVYIAGPLCNLSQHLVLENIMRAKTLGYKLRKSRCHVFIPHAQASSPLPEVKSERYNHELGESMGILSAWGEIMAVIPGESYGVERELELCRREGIACLPEEEILADLPVGVKRCKYGS